MPRSLIRTLAASAGVLTVLTGLMVAVPPASAEPVPVAPGSLSWGVKESFRNYVSGGGANPESIAVGGGASVAGDGSFGFPLASGSYDPDTRTTIVEFEGSVRFRAHPDPGRTDHYILDMTLADPAVTLSADQQVLTMEVVSRVLATGELKSYGRIPVVNLDSTGASLDTGGGTTRWSDLAASLAAASVPAFTFYSEGVAFDEVAFEYEGEGGAPDLGEHWSTPGAPAFAAGAAWPNPDSTTSSDYHPVYLSEDGTTLHSVTVRGSAMFLAALDADQLTPLSRVNAGVAAGQARTTFDPASQTVYIYERVTAVGSASRVLAAQWNPDAGSYELRVVGALPANQQVAGVTQRFTIRGFVWSAALGRVLVVGGYSNTTTVGVFSFPGTGANQPLTQIPLPDNPATEWYGAVGAESRSWAAVADGSLVVVRPGGVPALRVTIDGTGATVTEIPGTLVPPATSYSGVFGNGSTLALTFVGTQGRFLQTLRYDGGAVTPIGEPLALPGVDISYVAVAGDGTVYVKDAFAGVLHAILDGRLIGTQPMPDLAGLSTTPNAFAVGADHTLYASRLIGGAVHLQRLVRLGLAPTVDSHPASVSVRFDAPRARFTATAHGTPAPAIQWQEKGPSATRFADLPSATGTELSVTPAGAVNGTQYRAVFTNPAGAVATEPATLTVLTPPSILAQPVSASVGAGGSAQFLVMPAGNPYPEISWQRRTGGGWADLASGRQFTVDGGTLTVANARADQDGTRFRAKLVNQVGTVHSNQVELAVTGDPVVPVPQEDGSIVGVKNQVGAYTQVKPGVDIRTTGSTVLTVTGRGFTKHTNQAGVYVLFGYLVRSPAGGGAVGNGYDYLAGGGSSGQEGQLFVAWPDNHETGGAAHASFSSTSNGRFTATGLRARPRFTGASGAAVDCLDRRVICGVLTIGAHGGADAAVETFTPVYFHGQEIPDGPVTPPSPPVVEPPAADPPPADDPTEAGWLSWGVKASFRSYITGPIAHGTISVSGGATGSGDGYRFGQSTADWDAGTGLGSAGYRGTVHFAGHSGILDLTLADPVVRIESATSATLLVTVNGDRLPIADVDLGAANRRDGTGGGVSYANAPVTLAGEGVTAFSYGSSEFYPAGTAMDPLSFAIGGTATAPGGGEPATVASHQDEPAPSAVPGPASQPQFGDVSLEAGTDAAVPTGPASGEPGFGRLAWPVVNALLLIAVVAAGYMVIRHRREPAAAEPPGGE